MKRTTKIMMGIVAMLVIGISTFAGVFESEVALLSANSTTIGEVVVFTATMPIWFVMKGEVKTFKELSPEDFAKLDVSEMGTYLADKYKDDSVKAEGKEKAILKLIKDGTDESKTIVKAMRKEIEELKSTQIGTLEDAMKAQGEVIARLKAGGGLEEKDNLRKYIEENSTVLAAIKANRSLKDGTMDFTLKATQVAADINTGADYAEWLPGTERQPVRKTSIMNLFRRKKVSTEYIKYREENVVTRDAKFVVACATSTHTTKKTWINRTVELAKIRDIIDACIDMLDDYDFVESEIKELIEESIKLKADYELLLGAAALATDMLSINSISSEFNPANPLADFSFATGTPFQDANLEQLADAMNAQITIFGKENAWMGDTIIMNFKDFVNYRNLKDSNGNKLMHTLSDNVATIAGLTVVTSPIVVANTCYVFDSSKGSILDRQLLTVKTSFENNDNIEHETVTFVAVERLQFYVSNINQDAFMKCSDITVAIAAILKP